MPKMKRNANGSGTIYKRDDGRWEGKYSMPAADGSGKYVRKSIYGKTQEEVRKKLTEITAKIDEGTFVAPSQYRLSEWLENWLEVYVRHSVKEFTMDSYTNICHKYINPVLGKIKLKELNSTQIQKFYNDLLDKNLSGKTVKNIHGVLHRALEQAYVIGEIKVNPSDRCLLPKVSRPKIEPMEADEVSSFLSAIKGHKYENVYYLTLFAGLRQGEVLGLTWDCVDFENSMILINKQLKRTSHHKGAVYHLDSTKNGKERLIAVAPTVLDMLQRQREAQQSWSEKAGSAWSNEWNLVFTNALGEHLCHSTVYNNYKRIVKDLGIENKRFHDLRHTYAVASLESGDDIKTVQDNLGHATASFTLDVYGHVSRQMKMKSAQNMQQYINRVS